MLARISIPRVRALLSKTIMFSFADRHCPDATSFHPLASTISVVLRENCQRGFSPVPADASWISSKSIKSPQMSNPPQRMLCVHRWCQYDTFGNEPVHLSVRWFGKRSSRTPPDRHQSHARLHLSRQMHEHQSRVQLLLIAGRRPTSA